MSGYLEKPIKKNDLYELVERYLVWIISDAILIYTNHIFLRNKLHFSNRQFGEILIVGSCTFWASIEYW
jgi:hypothetical protein